MEEKTIDGWESEKKTIATTHFVENISDRSKKSFSHLLRMQLYEDLMDSLVSV